MNDHSIDPNGFAVVPPDGSVQPSHISAQDLDQNPVHKMILGPNGLRAGWRILIFALLFAAFSWSMNQCLRFAVHHHWIPRPPDPSKSFSPQAVIFGDSLFFLYVLVPTAIMAKIERRPIGAYGIPARGAFGKLFWEGWVWGFAALTALVVILRLTGNFYFGQVTLHGASIFYFGLMWGIAFLLVGFAEEYMLRGYLQYTLTQGIGFWPAAIALSLLFGWMHTHNVGETWVGILDVVLAGLMLCAALWKTGNLWFSIGLHFSWDWAESYFYGVRDSGTIAQGTLFTPSVPASRPWWLTGGTVGPEGSIFSCIIEIVLIALILWRFRETRYATAENPRLVIAA